MKLCVGVVRKRRRRLTPPMYDVRFAKFARVARRGGELARAVANAQGDGEDMSRMQIGHDGAELLPSS